MRRDLTRLLAGGVLGLLVVAAFATWRIWDQGNRDEARRAGAIVVLGAAQYDGTPSPVYRARLEHAIELFRAGHAPILVVTGGKRPGDRTTEAAAGRNFAIARGVPAEQIRSENRGRNTLESLRAVAGLLAAEGIPDAVFVSDPSHMLRVLRIARDEGIAGFGSPTPRGPNHDQLDRRADAILHELAALAVYFLTGEQPARDEQTEALPEIRP